MGEDRWAAFENPNTSRFRSLVEDLVKGSNALPTVDIPGGTLNVLDAIESGELSLYAENCFVAGADDAIRCLLAVYEELEKDEPDESFIESTVEQLKEYL